MASRVSVLETLVTTLQTNLISIQTLVSSLQSKVTVLETAKTDLTKALSEETAARKAADAALQSQIDSLIGSQTRINFSLSDRITAEQYARESADGDLLALIDTQARVFSAPALATFLPFGNETVLAELNLPVGRYFVTAKTVVSNDFHATIWNCSLYLDGSKLLDSVKLLTESVSTSLNTPNAEPVMQQVVALNAPGHITFQCRSGENDSYVSDIRLIAIGVGTIN